MAQRVDITDEVKDFLDTLKAKKDLGTRAKTIIFLVEDYKRILQEHTIMEQKLKLQDLYILQNTNSLKAS